MSAAITTKSLASSLTSGPLRSLSDICATIPGSRGASQLNPSTLTRWILRGTLSADGRRVRLAAVRTGCRWLTTLAAVAEYQTSLTDASLADYDAEEFEVRSPAQTRRACELAERELIPAGA